MKELKTIWGKVLDSKDKKKRIKRYLLESLLFALSMSILDVIGILASKNGAVFYFFDNYTINFIITVVITFSILFLVAYILNYLVTEHQLRK